MRYESNDMSPQGWPGRAAWVVLVIVALLLVLGFSSESDLKAQAQLEEQAQPPTGLSAYEQGRQQGRAELTGTVRAAYASGQRDAMDAVRTKPEGIALAQACRAMGARP